MKQTAFLLTAFLITGCMSRTGSDEIGCTSISACVEEIHADVTKNWFPGVSLGTEELVVTLLVSLGPKFEVEAVTVAESSGNEQFDSRAVMAVMATKQFRQLSALPLDEASQFRKFKLRFRPGGT